MSDLILQVEQLFSERDDRVLFENLSFSIAQGQVLQVEGQNGSGKTTLLRMLAGLSRNYDGNILFQGDPIGDVRDKFLSSLLYFGHQPGVKPTLTALENLHWYAAMQPSIDSSQIMSALDAVGLKGYEDVPCHTLSAGQQRRVSLARLHLSRALLWILDEPFTAIDKKGVAAQEALILNHAKAGGAVILTTHHELAISHQIRRINLDEMKGNN